MHATTFARAVVLLVALRGAGGPPPASAATPCPALTAARDRVATFAAGSGVDATLGKLLYGGAAALTAADALFAADHLPPVRRKLRAAIRTMAKVRRRIVRLRKKGTLDDATAASMDAEAAGIVMALQALLTAFGASPPACPPKSTTTTTTTTTTLFHPTFTFHTITIPPSTTTQPHLDYTKNPNYGQANLSGGFAPDPYSVGMTTGGAVNVAYLGGSCSGFATSAPDLRINFSAAGAALLRIYFVGANGDPAMVVNDPYGNFYCVDDSFGTVNPTLDFNSPASGSYDVWIASYAKNVTITGTLYLTGQSGNHP